MDGFWGSAHFDTGTVYDDNGDPECDYYYNYVFHDPTGGRHALGLEVGADGDCSSFAPPGGIINSGGDDTLDAEAQDYTYITDVADSDGNVYHFDFNFGGNANYPQYVEDRNGNKAYYRGDTETDSTGRTAYSISGVRNPSDAISISGVSTPYQVNWGSVSRNYNAGVSLAFANNANLCAASGPTNTGTNGVINSIVLPNGKSYQFYYDSTYGLLDEIVYPTGGWVKYTWGVNNLSEAVSIADYSGVGSCVYRYGTPVVTRRQVSFDGTNVAEEQDFTAYVTNWVGPPYYTEWISKSTTLTQTVVNAPNSRLAYTYGCNDFEPQPGGNYSYLCKPVENQIVYEDGNGTPLRTVNKTWQNGLLISEQTVLDDTNATSQISYNYGPFDTLAQKVETNYDGSRRTTNISFNTGLTGAGGYWVADRPSSMTVLDGSTVVAEVDYTYDSYGNALTKTEKCLNGCPGGSGDAITTYTYDNYGQVASKKDPNQYTTRYSYMCSDTYLSQIANPDNTTQNFSYDCSSGELLSSQDQSGATTSYSYTPPCTGTPDPLGRLGEISYPDGGEVTYCYNDNAPNPSITVDKVIGDGIADYVSTSTMDGLGHVVQTALISDPGGTDYTTMTYDGEEQLYQQSNPYRSTSDLTYGITTYNHDALGRLVSTVYPDNSSASVSYSGSCKTTTDPAARTNETCTDAWGRLTSDTDGLSNLTTYGYDIRDHLIAVTQGVQSRSFQYNSLSEMYQSTYPESGTTNYTYDLDGNMQTRTDARTITTTYSYDNMRHLTGKTYSNNDASVVYSYSGTNCLGLSSCYNKGRRTGMTDGSGGTTWAYDSMGRTGAKQQTIGASTRATTYSYYLDGSLRTLTYPESGRMLSYALNSAEQETGLQDTTDGITYVSSASYGPQGALVGMQNGNNVAFSELYDKRLRPSTITAALYGTNLLALTYGYDGDSNVTCLANGAAACPNLSASGTGWDFKGTFGYDSLNRITSASSTGTSSYTQNFGYSADGSGGRFGNVTCTSAGNAPCAQLSFNPQNNRLTAIGSATPTYDAAGDMTSDGAGEWTNQYTWNAEGKTATVTPWGSATDTFVYDGDGDRVNDTGVQTLFWYGAGGELLEVHEPDGPTNRDWIYFDGRRVARFDVNTNSEAYYLYDDANGSLRVITDSSGTGLCNANYYPFGGRIGSGCDGYDHFQFAQLYSDPTTGGDDGNDSAANRRFNPTLGRWLSPDPGGLKVVKIDNPQTWDMYTYATENPMTLNDPSGLVVKCDTDMREKDAAACQEIIDIVNEKDKKGNYLYPKLHAIYDSLNTDKRTFIIRNTDLGSGTAGRFDIREVINSKDFNVGVINLNFKVIGAMEKPSESDISGFNKYQGLIGKLSLELAETFGHEGEHGVYALNHLQDAVRTQLLVNDSLDAIQVHNMSQYFLDQSQAKPFLDATELDAQSAEQKINQELNGIP